MDGCNKEGEEVLSSDDEEEDYDDEEEDYDGEDGSDEFVDAETLKKMREDAAAQGVNLDDEDDEEYDDEEEGEDYDDEEEEDEEDAQLGKRGP